MRALLLPVLAAVGLLAGGCGIPGRGDEPAARVDADAPVADECGDGAPAATRVVLASADGTPLGAALIGDEGSATWVVFAHGASQALCRWLDLATEVARDDGVATLSFDFRGRGASGGDAGDDARLPDDLRAAVDEARARGAARVVVVGASMGATTAVVTAAQPESGIDAVLALSPPLVYASLDAGAAAAGVAVPLVAMAAADDLDDASRAIAGDAGAGRAVIVPGDAHGGGLVDDPATRDDVARLIAELVAGP